MGFINPYNKNSTKTNMLLANSIETILSTNYSILVFFVFLYVFRRSTQTSTPSLNIIKGQLKTIGLWMTRISVLSLLLYTVLFAFLSTIFKISRNIFELTGILTQHYTIRYKHYEIDLPLITTYFLRISEVFLISSLYILSSIWSPIHDLENINNNHISFSITTLSKIWGVFRIPMYAFFFFGKFSIDKKIMTFTRIICLGTEFFVTSILFFVLVAKYGTVKERGSLENPKLLGLLLIFYSITKYIVNILDIPIPIIKQNFYFISSTYQSLQLGIYIILTNMYCPSKSKRYVENTPGNYSVKTREEQDNSLSKISNPESQILIEFNELSA